MDTQSSITQEVSSVIASPIFRMERSQRSAVFGFAGLFLFVRFKEEA